MYMRRASNTVGVGALHPVRRQEAEPPHLITRASSIAAMLSADVLAAVQNPPLGQSPISSSWHTMHKESHVIPKMVNQEIPVVMGRERCRVVKMLLLNAEKSQ
jgi:hypothetical protein